MVEKLALKIHLAFAMIGLVGGIAGFVAFVFAFHNFHAGIWSLISGVMATFCLHMHYINLKEQLEMNYTKDRLKFTGLLGLFMTIISLLAAICYFVYSLVNHIPMLPVQHSLILGAVQAFLTFKWAANLVYFSRKHYKNIDQMRLLD